MKVPAHLPLCFLALLLLPVLSPALEVEETMPNGKVARAEYMPGEPGKAAILILHGFLQTHQFSTVARLAAALNEELDYTVLTPTLTLGIGRRKSSLACEAIQNHSLEDGVREVDAWVKWLLEKGHRKIVVIGHSTGSVVLTAWLPQAPPEVVDALLISLTHFAPDHRVFGESAHPEKRARRLADGERADELAEFPIAYCRQYLTLPKNILSYYRWDDRQVLRALEEVPMPVTVIIGSEDKRMDQAWLSSLQARKKVDVRIVEGADHFFDSEHEFSLLDAVDELLQEIPGK